MIMGPSLSGGVKGLCSACRWMANGLSWVVSMKSFPQSDTEVEALSEAFITLSSGSSRTSFSSLEIVFHAVYF